VNLVSLISPARQQSRAIRRDLIHLAQKLKYLTAAHIKRVQMLLLLLPLNFHGFKLEEKISSFAFN